MQHTLAMTVDVRFTSDPNEALDRTRRYLHGDAVRHNVLCTLLAARIHHGEDIRYWWAVRDGQVLSAVFQSPVTAPALVATLQDDAVEPLASAVAAAIPAVEAANGFAADSSRFAGAFATVTRLPGRPVVAQRLYEIRAVAPPRSNGGRVRPAGLDDLDLATRWVEGFDADTGGSVSGELPEARARDFIDAGRLHLLEDAGVPRASAVVSSVEAGVARIGFVYTPPEERGRGHASTIVAELSSRVLDAGNRCILYTQLTNPVSNAVYQRLGYRPVDEQIGYRFGD